MKKFGILFIFLLSLNLLQILATDSKIGINIEKDFILNPEANEPLLKFISTAPLENIEGYVKDYTKIKSWAKLNPANLESLTGEISFPVQTIKTGISTRDKHLYSSTWLDTEKYPDIKFTIKQIKNVKVVQSNNESSKIDLIINGNYSMHGKTKNIDVNCNITYLKENEKTKKRASGDLMSVEGKFEIDLKDFDVKGKEGVIGSKVGEKITIEFKLFYSSK